MAQVTLSLGEPTQINAGVWVQWDERDTGLGDLSAFSADDNPRALIRLRVFRDGRVQFQTINEPDGSSGFSSREDLTSEWEGHNPALTVQAAGIVNLALSGPDSTDSTTRDSSEPYAWTPAVAPPTSVESWFDAYEAAGRPAVTLVVDDGVAGGVTEHVVGAGAVAWTFAVGEPTVTLTPGAPVDHVVAAGAVAWAFDVPEPSITHGRPATDHVVAAGGVAWSFAVPEPTVTLKPAPVSGEIILRAGELAVRVDRDSGRYSAVLGTTTLRGTGPVGEWVHVAVRRTAADEVELWIDGVRVDRGPAPNRPVLDGQTLDMAVARGNDIDMALDEWGVWSEAIDVADLAARARHERWFGGYVFGITDRTDLGPADQHVLDIDLAGYGLRLDTTFVRQIYASASGSSVREIVQDVLERADVDDDFTSHGVELSDTVTRAVFPVQSAMEILRSLADTHGSIVVVDEWREIDMVRRANVEQTALVLSGGRTGNVASIGRTTEPRFFASRAVVVGRGEPGTIEDVRTGDGATVRFDASQPIGEVLSILEDGVDQTFEGMGARWTVDTEQQRFELAAGETPPSTAADGLKFTYVSAVALVVSADNQAAITSIGFPVSVRVEDDTIDTPGVARVVAQSRVDRHDQLIEEFVAETIQGAVKTRIRPGTAPTFDFPRQGLSSTRLLIERVSTSLGRGRVHPVVQRLTATAQDYQGDSEDAWRAIDAYRPPAPRPMVGTAADPNQTIIDPGNVAIPASLPLQLGGSPVVLVTDAAWEIPDGAILERVSGHEIALPLVLSFMARCSPRGGTLGSGQELEIRLWDATTNVAIGSAVAVDTTAADRYVLRGIALPLREFDLTWQGRVTGGLRGGMAWGVKLSLDV